MANLLQDNPQLAAGIDAGMGALSGLNPMLANIYAGLKNAGAVNAMKGEVQGREDQIQAWYDKNYNQDYLSTNVGKSVLEKAREQMFNANKQASNTAAVTGATGEAALAAKTQNQEGYNKLLSSLAAMGTARQDQVDRQKMYQDMSIFDSKMGIHNADILSAQTMQQNAGKQMDSIVSLAKFFSGGGA